MRKLPAALLLLASAQISMAQDAPSGVDRYAGYWTGTLTVPGSALRLALSLSRAADGSLTATLISLDQGNAKLPSTATVYNDTLVVTVTAVVATYTATLNQRGDTLTGTFLQGSGYPLTMVKTTPPTGALRPQEPKPPFPYQTRDVTVNSVKGVTLAGTIVMPAGTGPFPAVVLVTGSGPQNRDEELMGHKPFLVIADYLARHGIASLRCDDRGVAKSTGTFGGATTADFADDAEAAVRFLKAQPGIARVGIVGHSEGGVIAPMVAARSTDVAFIVLLAGTGLRGDSLMLLQEAAIARAGGAPEAFLDRMHSANSRLFSAIIASHDPAEASTRLNAVIEQIVKELPENERELGRKQMAEARAQLMAPWFMYFIKHDPAADLRRVHVPVLAMNGTLDLQVPSRQNLPAIAGALKQGGNTHVKIVELPGLNHLFQTAKTGLVAEYEQITETFSPTALEIMASWISGMSATKAN
jgi:uncharacterized protein